MQRVYSFFMRLAEKVLPIAGTFNEKMGLSVSGRKEVFATLKSALDRTKQTIWLHAASLGEFEQGVPIIEALQEEYPDHQWVITFFSPSGYEVKKNNAFAKATTYLPLDTTANVNLFLDLVDPEMVFFVKYEFWPNYLTELKRRNIRTFLISGVFRESQPFFKFYGEWMTTALAAFEHFFLQDQACAKALSALGFSNYTVSGDTRFDRVTRQIAMDNSLGFIETFKGDALCVVCGSTWPEDDDVIVTFVNKKSTSVKYIIAPHEIKPEKITALERKISVPVVRYSDHTEDSLRASQVLIIDTIGLLTKIYSYADIAYVGGAMGTTGLHNILEPATFGVPIVIGSQYDKFPEAKVLEQLAGLYSVADTTAFEQIMNTLITDAKFRAQTGMIAEHFVNSNTGATHTIVEYLTAHEKMT